MNENQYYAKKFGYGQPMQPYYAPAQVFIKCRPVVSIEEARAAQIDLDGTPTVFTDFGNKKIYTKQVSQDGTVSLRVYGLIEDANAAAPSYVTRDEFNQVIAQINDAFSKMNTPKSSPIPPKAAPAQSFNI